MVLPLTNNERHSFTLHQVIHQGTDGTDGTEPCMFIVSNKSNNIIMLASQQFASGVLSPQENSSLEKSGDGMWKTSSFYLDSSGRSRIHCKLQLKFPSEDVLNAVLATNCLRHVQSAEASSNNGTGTSSSSSSNVAEAKTATDQAKEKSGSDAATKKDDSPPPSVCYSLGIEAKVTLTFGTGEAIAAQVESVTIQSYSMDRQESCLYFDTEINLHVSRSFDATVMNSNMAAAAITTSLAAANSSSSDSALQGVVGVKLNLEIAAVLWEKLTHVNRDAQVSTGLRNLYVGRLSSRGGAAGAGSAGVGGGGHHYKNKAAAHRQALQTRTFPFSLQVALTQALSISARSLPGPSNSNMGETLVSLTIRHSNTHAHQVAITNIALHPAFSHETSHRTRSAITSATNRNDDDRKSSVIDMSKSVHWGFAQKSDPQLPLTLGPHEAYSTVLTIKSLGGSKCQTFSSPVSVTAVVSKKNSSSVSDGGSSSSSSAAGSLSGDGQDNIVARANVAWTSGASAVERSDAFRVNMTLPQEECTVGAAFAVALEVFNLSPDLRNVNLVLAKQKHAESQKKNIKKAKQPKEPSGKDDSNRVVVPPILAGLALKDDCYYDELLAMDESLWLGEFRGLSCNKAKLRFIPLRAGTLKLPNFGLVDETSGKLYQCMHNLQVVAREHGR
jgi:hypothetical protein